MRLIRDLYNILSFEVLSESWYFTIFHTPRSDIHLHKFLGWITVSSLSSIRSASVKFSNPSFFKISGSSNASFRFYKLPFCIHLILRYIDDDKYSLWNSKDPFTKPYLGSHKKLLYQ